MTRVHRWTFRELCAWAGRRGQLDLPLCIYCDGSGQQAMVVGHVGDDYESVTCYWCHGTGHGLPAYFVDMIGERR
jgi:hypothetical protein